MASDASPIPDLFVSVVPSGSLFAFGSGRVGASQFISNGARGVVGEYDLVAVGACGGISAGLVGCVSSGAEFEPCDSDGHLSGKQRVVCESVNAVGAIGGGCPSGAVSASVPCPSDQHSEEEGECVDGVCVLGLDGHVECVVGVDASVVRLVERVCGLPPSEEWSFVRFRVDR